jgi:hypothetical protein
MTTVSKRRVVPNPISEEDMAWAESVTNKALHAGVSLVEAVQFAALALSERILEREFRKIEVAETAREERIERRRAELAAEHEELRSKLQAKATQGQRPTLKMTLGDLIKAKGKSIV